MHTSEGFILKFVNVKGCDMKVDYKPAYRI